MMHTESWCISRVMHTNTRARPATRESISLWPIGNWTNIMRRSGRDAVRRQWRLYTIRATVYARCVFLEAHENAQTLPDFSEKFWEEKGIVLHLRIYVYKRLFVSADMLGCLFLVLPYEKMQHTARYIDRLVRPFCAANVQGWSCAVHN